MNANPQRLDHPATDKASPAKELLTAVFGLVVVLATVAMAVQLFRGRADPPVWVQGPTGTAAERIDPFARGVQVLGLLLPLAGAFIGYYTGRVIADRSIEQARTEAHAAKSGRAKAIAVAQEGLRKIESRIRAPRRSITADAGREGTTDEALQAVVDETRTQLAELG